MKLNAHHFCRSLLFSVFFVFASPAIAQLSGTDAFMQGQWTEVGVNQCGVFGSENTSGGVVGPYGPYNNTGFTVLGFIAEPDMDGWAVGFPPYCGDYFVPGSPVEGWAIQFGAGPTFTNTDQPCNSFDIPGSIISYTDLGTEREVVWQGNLVSGGSSLQVTQTTTVPDNALYFVTFVEFCNTGATDINDLYYCRNVDPDNEQEHSGTFTTTNTIVSQPPGDCDALVTAQGNTFGCFLGLGARDSMARVSWGNFFTGDPYDVWNGLGGYSSSGTQVADQAISVAFRVPLIAAGECETVAFAYVLDPDDLAVALDATAAVGVFADTVDITASGMAFVCGDDSVNLQLSGVADYEWTWDPPVGLNVDTGTLVIAAPPSTTTYTATGTGGLCDTITRSITVEVDTTKNVKAGDDMILCIGDTLQLNGAGSTTLWWTPAFNISDDSISNPLIWPTSTTQYVISTYTNVPECVITDTVDITVVVDVPVVAEPDTAICFGESVDLLATGALTYTWTPIDGLDDALISNPISTPDSTVQYIIEGIDANGCINYDTLDIIVNPLPEVDAGPDQIIDLVADESALINVLSPTGVAWMWDPSDGLSADDIPDPTAQPDFTTTYIVTVTDANGCLMTDTITIEVLNEVSVIIPDAFTPNGDGLNDFLAPFVRGLVEVVDITIYDRWGTQVFYSTDKNIGWDGTYRGKNSEVDTYIVVVRILDFTGQPVNVAGTTTLIR